MLVDVIGHRGPGTFELKTPRQLLSDERVVERFADRQKLSQEISYRLRPQVLVVAAGGLQLNGFLAL